MSLAESLIDRYLEQHTPGMSNAIRKNINATDPAMECPECGFPIPRYPGRYPKKCGDCGALLVPEES